MNINELLDAACCTDAIGDKINLDAPNGRTQWTQSTQLHRQQPT